MPSLYDRVLLWYPFFQPMARWKNLSGSFYLPLVLHMCVAKLDQHWFREILVACSVPSHHLNQCWLIGKWTLRNELQWNLNGNTKLFVHENAYALYPCEQTSVKFESNINACFKKYIWKYHLHNGGHFFFGYHCLCKLRITISMISGLVIRKYFLWDFSVMDNELSNDLT